jgi:hypothetical protein
MQVILNVVNSLIVPEMTCLTGKRASDARAGVSKLLFELLRIEGATHKFFGDICSLTGQLLEMSDWKMSVGKMMQQFVGVTVVYWITKTAYPSSLYGSLRVNGPP